VAATTLDVWKNADALSSDNLSLLLVGFITSFLVAIAAVKFLLRFVETHTFVVFGVYRMILAALFFLFVL
jgi:undecaprenyl-diphosphatase